MIHRSLSTLSILLLLLCGLLPTSGSQLEAHDMPMCIVQWIIDEDGNYRLELQLDIDSVINNFATDDEYFFKLAKDYANAGMGDAANEERLILLQALAQHIHISANEEKIDIHNIDILDSTGDIINPIQHIKISGTIPIESTRFQWHTHPLLQTVHLYVHIGENTARNFEILNDHGKSSVFTAKNTNSWTIIGLYIIQGIYHIIPAGLDHILFICGLYFACKNFTQAAWQVSAFTVAHSFSLAAIVFGVIIPDFIAVIIEPAIAASIFYVAIENILFPSMTKSRPLIVFLFGLLHGLGFASVLGAYGLPYEHIFSALIGFNLGVEIAQIGILLIMTLILYRLRKQWDQIESNESDKSINKWTRFHRFISVPSNCIIGLIAAYFLIERVLL